MPRELTRADPYAEKRIAMRVVPVKQSFRQSEWALRSLPRDG